MADYVGSTFLDIEQLNGLSARLIDHADENVTARALERDLRTDARVAGEHPSWRSATAAITTAGVLHKLIGKEG